MGTVNRDRYVGISLIEQLLVITIISVLLTLAIPTYGDLVITNRINSASSELHAALLYTRSEALKFRGNVIICRSSSTLSENPHCDQGADSSGLGWGNGWLIFHDKDQDKQFSSKDTILRAQGRVFAGQGEGSIVTVPNRNQLVFNATGQTFGSYMRFHVRRPLADKDSKHDRFVCIASGGRARISKEACN